MLAAFTVFARERRERLAALAAETIDLAKVPNQTSMEHAVIYSKIHRIA